MSLLSRDANRERTSAQALTDRINAALDQVPDEAWNYGRLRVVVMDLARIRGPYAIGCDWIRPLSRVSREQLAESQREEEFGRC